MRAATQNVAAAWGQYYPSISVNFAGSTTTEATGFGATTTMAESVFRSLEAMMLVRFASLVWRLRTDAWTWSGEELPAET